jgi:hypothetical protein
MKRKKEGILNMLITAGWCCFLLTILLYSCSSPKGQSAENIIQVSLDAIGKKSDRDKIQNLVSLSDCMSPNGKYTTEIHTASGGYSYFKQVYSYKTEPFEAVVRNKTEGFSVADSMIKLSKETISVIRGHEFQNLVLEVDQRFHDFEKPERIDTGGVKAYRVKAKDELYNECLLFFDVNTGLLSAIHSRNPDDTNAVIKIRFSNWKKVQDLQLPHHVDINQSGKIYAFDFTKIIFNSPEFKMFYAAAKR